MNGIDILTENIKEYIDEEIMNKMKYACQDPIVEAVREKLKQRSDVGIKKYNTTLDQNDKDNYLLHLQQELMDGCNYVEAEMQKMKKFIQLYPNDADLGKKIREIYG